MVSLLGRRASWFGPKTAHISLRGKEQQNKQPSCVKDVVVGDLQQRPVTAKAQYALRMLCDKPLPCLEGMALFFL